ncbi:MAG: [Fe-Fe] hydrogenase large subunit C-terminal domain-containing protein [Pyramidobacter sp.]|nr:[Fe-Fe] hydrogenase large subunit C-terminal domain-containing protein [Pyramidobacter sp.]
MEKMYPVYTLNNECQDCYRCVRRCPVKAIRIRDGMAQVIPSRCIACAACVLSCPSQAKQVRSDVEKVKKLFLQDKKVIVSLAPSWRGPFEYSQTRMISLLKKLGFYAVSETALGAQQVSIASAQILNDASSGLFISSACPVIVDYVRLYRPEFVKNIIPLASPALTHARLLKDTYGDDISVVFIGPCVGKKNESDRHPDLIDAALTFDELRVWLRDENITLDEEEEDPNACFVPEHAYEGALYPLDGGMNETIRRVGVKKEVQLINICSLNLFRRALEEFSLDELKQPVFVEALACIGGCVAGPCISTRRSSFSIVSKVMEEAPERENIPVQPDTRVPIDYEATPVSRKTYTLEEINSALHKIGKYEPRDELNCAGCGYRTCRQMAAALLDGDAEPSMCASYMRQLATKKAAAMLTGMPSAMVMIDKEYNIIEANDAFVRDFIHCKDRLMRCREKIIGQPVASVLDWTDLFRTVFKTGKELVKERYPYEGKYYEVRIFPLEPAESIGAIITDITQSQSNREKVAKKANEVIARNISIVQEIACLLGEHMVETESILSSIADDSDDELKV